MLAHGPALRLIAERAGTHYYRPVAPFENGLVLLLRDAFCACTAPHGTWVSVAGFSGELDVALSCSEFDGASTGDPAAQQSSSVADEL